MFRVQRTSNMRCVALCIDVNIHFNKYHQEDNISLKLVETGNQEHPHKKRKRNRRIVSQMLREVDKFNHA